MGNVTKDEEADQVRLAQSGDRAAYSALVGRYWKPLYGWLAGLCDDDHLAEDLTQVAFVRAWQALPRLNSAEAFRVWLFRIARNAWLTRERSLAPGLPTAAPGESVAPGGGPVSEAMHREALGALRAAILRLPPPYRDAYLLWTHERMPYSAMADVLDITEETARWRVCEARRKLALDMKSFLDPTEP